MTKNIEIINLFYEAYNRKDFAAIQALCAPQIKIYQTEELPWGGHFEGAEGVGRFSAHLFSQIESKVEISKIFASGNRVTVSGQTIGTAKNNGKDFRIDAVHVWTLDKGKITKFEVYIDTPAMLAALAGDNEAAVS